MTAPVSFKRYGILDASHKELFFTDFASAIVVKDEFKSILLNDLKNLAFNPLPFNNITQLKFELTSNNSAKEVIIERDYVAKTNKIFVNASKIPEDIYIYLSKELGIQINAENWNKLILNSPDQTTLKESLRLISESFTPPQAGFTEFENAKQELEAAKLKYTQALTDDEKSKFERLLEVQSRIKIFEQEIGDFQNSKKNKEDIAKKLKDAEISKSTYLESLTSVNSLLQKRSEVLAELQKYGELGTDLSLEEKVSHLKTKKIDRNIETLRNVTERKKELLGINRSPEESELKFLGVPVVFLITLQVMLTTIYYLVSMQSKVFVIGLFSFLLLTIFLALINILKDKANVYIYDEDKIKNTKVSYHEIDPENLNESKFFLGAAMIGAIKQELKSVDALIATHLGGKTLEQVNIEKTRIENEYLQLKSESDRMESSELSSEEYYKKRREIDILKIEQENVEYALGNKVPAQYTEVIDFANKVNDLKNKIDAVANVIEGLPLVVIGAGTDMVKLMQDYLKNRQVVFIN